MSCNSKVARQRFLEWDTKHCKKQKPAFLKTLLGWEGGGVVQWKHWAYIACKRPWVQSLEGEGEEMLLRNEKACRPGGTCL
jgi:hypothetical protein